jgi:hypothetical protein
MNRITEILLPNRLLRHYQDVFGVESVRGRILAIRRNIYTGELLKIHGINIVTDAGDKFYAQKAMGETPTIAFNTLGGLRLGTNATTPTKAHTDVGTFLAGSGHTIKATYPKTADADTDNTGAGVDIASWTYEYLTTEGNGADIAEGAVVNSITSPTAALTHFLFAALFTKTAADTLKVIVNHQFNGV